MEENMGGWTVKNFSKGLTFFAAGFLIDFLGGIAALSDSDKIPFWYYIIISIAIFLMTLGVLGFWLLIPAFQKWRHTKNEWLAWTFLTIVVVLLCALFYFRNMPI
jgi:Kef-type K+ transport system membrane component KefB